MAVRLFSATWRMSRKTHSPAQPDLYLYFNALRCSRRTALQETQCVLVSAFFFSPSSWKALKCHSMWWKCVRIIILPFIWENRLTSMGFVSHETSTNIATDPQVSQNSTPENSWLSVCKTPYLLCWHKLSSIQWLSWAWKLIQKYVKNELEWKHIWIR